MIMKDFNTFTNLIILDVKTENREIVDKTAYLEWIYQKQKHEILYKQEQVEEE